MADKEDGPIDVVRETRDHLMKTFGIDETEATRFAKEYIAEVEKHRPLAEALNEVLTMYEANRKAVEELE